MILWLLFILFLCLPDAAEAATRYASVAGGGSAPCTSSTTRCTLSTALGQMVGGDTLILGNGTYGVGFTDTSIPNGLDDITGRTIVRGETVGAAIVQSIAFHPSTGITKRWITFQDFVVDGDYVDGRNVALGANAGGSVTRIRFQNMEVRETYRSCVEWGGSINLTQVTSNEFIGGSVHHCGLNPPPPPAVFPIPRGVHGFYIQTSNNLVDGVEIYEATGYGIHQFSYSSAAIQNNNIYRNNRIHHNGAVLDQGAPAIILWNASGNAAAGNDNRVYNNLIYKQYQSTSIAVSSGQRNLIYSNSIEGNGTACGGLCDYVVKVDSGASNTEVKNNIIFNNNVNQIFNGGSGTQFAGNLCSTGMTTGCQSTTGTSPFVSAAASNYTLTSTSIALNAGVALSASFNADIVGVTRPQPSGGGWDIGAYETTAAPATVTPELVVQMGLDEGSGTAPQDNSGKGNNGVFSSSVSYVDPGKYNKALSFTGVDAGIQRGGVFVNASSSLDLTTGFTIMAWAKPATTLTAWNTIIAKGSNYYLYGSSSGTCASGAIYGGFYDAGGAKTICYSTPLPTTYTHVALTYDASTQQMILYINGGPVTQQTITGNLPVNTNPLTIGTSSVGETFPGDIDEVRVYNYALPPTAGASQCINAPSILRDMNCPINPVTTPASASGFKVGIAGGVKLGVGGSIKTGN